VFFFDHGTNTQKENNNNQKKKRDMKKMEKLVQEMMEYIMGQLVKCETHP
jgi:hypothetical protein